MINNSVIFYSSAFLIAIFTMLSLFAKNAIYSILSAMFAFLSGAIIFYMLGSEYNAIIQAAIYGIAIPIILGISVMFIKQEHSSGDKNFIIWYLTVLFSGIFIMTVVYLNLLSLTIQPEIFNITETNNLSFTDVMRGFKQGLYINYVWAFELLSLLLTIIIAGLTMFKKERY